jgi:hypothetical protein
MFIFVQNSGGKVFGVDLHPIYSNELKVVKDTTDTQNSETYLDLHLETDNEGRLKQISTTNAIKI